MSTEKSWATLPLAGLKVVELGHFVAGPYCAKLLADAGAEVVKVEGPEGDESRRRGPFPGDRRDPDASGLFLYLNSNKLGITLNLRSPQGVKVLDGLLKDADILVENHRPAEMDELGLAFPTLHERHPRLIVTSISPFGQTGPYRDYLGDDLIAVNMGGLAYATPGLPDRVADPEREPPLRAATQIADYTAAITASAATMFAVMAREWDGVGRHVDVSEQEALASTVTIDTTASSYLGIAKLRGAPRAGLMPNGYFPCKDGYVALTAITQEHWLSLVEVMGSPDWAENPLFSEGDGRTENWDALELLILDWTMSRTAEEIGDLTQARGLPCFSPYEVDRALASEQVAARGFLHHMEVAPGHTAGLPGTPFRLGECQWPLRMPAPRLGEHTNALLSERLGYGSEEVARLREAGVI